MAANIASGVAASERRNSAPSIAITRHDVSVVASACRGEPFSTASSPKIDPGPAISSTTSRPFGAMAESFT